MKSRKENSESFSFFATLSLVSNLLAECQPCRSGWILFKNKCYLFYNKDPPWKTWGQSREYCKHTAADLVVVDDLEEQVSSNNKTTTQLQP